MAGAGQTHVAMMPQRGRTGNGPAGERPLPGEGEPALAAITAFISKVRAHARTLLREAGTTVAGWTVAGWVQD
jgi:hypothetical protein